MLINTFLVPTDASDPGDTSTQAATAATSGQEDTELSLQMEDQQRKYEQQLEEQRDYYARKLGENSATIHSMEEQLRASELKTYELQQVLDTVQQYDFIVPNFKQLKAEKKLHTVRSMYTRPGGYKFGMEVHPYGTGVGASSHVSVRVWSHEGEYDGHLKFPAKFVIDLELLNQHKKDDGHYKKQISCLYKEPSHGIFIGSEFKFITHGELKWNEGKQTQYLKDDRLWFRITAITTN